MSKHHLSQLLYLSNGLQAGQGRTVANAGNLGSVTLYPLILAPGGEIPAGIYAYEPAHHQLIPFQLGNFQTWFATQVALQPEIGEAPLAIALVSHVERLRQKYGHRSYRLALLDAGHVSAHLYLVATALGLNICACAGFVDDEINLGLGLDGLDQACMLISVIGQDRGSTTGVASRNPV
jgi:SagB-type dehydrogenase family enzyme